jgi:hypothetical protein
VTTRARVVRRAGTHTVWLEVDYDGLEPPVALLRDLAGLGWRPPAVAAPPHDAIDWSQPDRERGLGYTIRPWRVLGATVDPPAGTGPRGAWTEPDADTFLTALGEVLAQHGLTADGGATTVPADAAPPPASVTAGAGATGAPPIADPTPTLLVTFVVEAEAAPALRAGLEADRLAHRTQAATISVPQRYRGRDFTTDVSAVRFEVAVPAAGADPLVASLEALGVDRALSRLTIEPLEPAGEPTAGLAAVHPIRRPRGVA